MGWNWGDMAKGGAGGAMAGSAFGPVGTAIGGLAGGFMGGAFGGSPTSGYQDQLNAYAQMAGGRNAPQAGESGFRQNQQGLVSMLEAQARGQGPSLAAQQLQAGQDRGVKQASGLAASGRGPNAALAQMQAMNMMGGNQAQVNQDAAMARIQEQYNAQNQLGLVLQGARGQDQNLSQMNLEAKLRQMGINDSATLQALLGAGGMAGQPTMGDQMLAGGGGMLGFLAGQRGQQGNNGQATPTPMGQAAGGAGIGSAAASVGKGIWGGR